MIRQIHPIPAFADNYIWTVLDADSDLAWVVDPGDAAPVIDYLESGGLRLAGILITHHHADHTGGLEPLIERYGPVVYGPAGGSIPGISDPLREGDRIDVCGHAFEVLEVPGHTLDHIAYHCGRRRPPLLFCGDTLFAAGCGRLFEGTPALMHASLAKLAALSPDTLVYCTHEYTLANLRFAGAADPDNGVLAERAAREKRKRDDGDPTLPSNIRLELDTNPFLRCGHPALKASAESYANAPLADEAEVFGALRSWKDDF